VQLVRHGQDTASKLWAPEAWRSTFRGVHHPTESQVPLVIHPEKCHLTRIYDALAETIIGLYETEVTCNVGPWRGPEHVELATLEWVSWFNTVRLMEPLGFLPPAEFEAQFHIRETLNR